MNILVHVNVDLSSLTGATVMHGLFVVTTLVIFNIKSILSAIPSVHHPQQSDAVLIIYIVHGLLVIIVVTSFVIFLIVYPP